MENEELKIRETGWHYIYRSNDKYLIVSINISDMENNTARTEELPANRMEEFQYKRPLQDMWNIKSSIAIKIASTEYEMNLKRKDTLSGFYLDMENINGVSMPVWHISFKNGITGEKTEYLISANTGEIINKPESSVTPDITSKPKNEITWDTIISNVVAISAIVGIISAIVSIYFKLKNPKAQALLDAREKHTLDLKKFLETWYDKFPYRNAFTSTISEYVDMHDFSDIEGDWKYQDLIKFHLPAEYKNLPVKWETYKEIIKEYGKERYKLYVQIKNDVFKETKLTYNPEWKGEHIISDNFIRFIYEQCITWIAENIYLYENKDIKQERNELWFSGNGLARGTEEEMAQAKEIFYSKMFNEGYLIKYRSDILKLNEKKKILHDMDKEVKEIIGKLRGFPLLPGEKCDWLKHI